MPKNAVLIVGIIVVIGVILGGVILFSSNKVGFRLNFSSEEDWPSLTLPPNIITYTNSGYSPSVSTVKAGDTVKFVNTSSGQMWTASAIHPTHRVYPGTDIAECGGAPTGAMFDACTGTNSGGSWPFTFQNSGTWRYHNHLNPGHTGTVIVE